MIIHESFHYAIFPRHTGTGAEKQKEPTSDLSITKLFELFTCQDEHGTNLYQ